MKKLKLSQIFLAVGIFCIAVPAIHEALSVPWASINNENVNDVVMREPAPLKIDHIKYGDIDSQTPETDTLNASGLPVKTAAGLAAEPANAFNPPGILPGEDGGAFEEPAGEPAPAPTPSPEPTPPQYMLLGAVKIPRIDISENLIEGSAGRLLDYGVGHVEGTAAPGAEGNSVIAAHRVSNKGMEPFRYLDNMQIDDVIRIDFNHNSYVYEVFESFIVSKHDVWVMAPVENETHVLTLVTCDPVIHPGNRPDRLIVRARLVETENNATVG